MSWVASAVVGGAVIGGAASMFAGAEQAGAARDAAATSADAARYQTDVQKEIYDQSRADQTPWREAGYRALAQLASLTGLGALPPAPSEADRRAGAAPIPVEPLTAGAIMRGIERGKAPLEKPQAALAPAPTPGSASLLRPFSMADYEADPGYAFRQAEGMKAIERSAASRGGVLSGGALRATQRFGQGLASEEYGNAFNRYQTNQSNIFNRLAALAGVGQAANAATGQAGSNYANAVTGISQANATNQGNALLAAGNARASGYQGVGNALGGTLGTWGMLKFLKG